MTIINPKSISGITSITTASGADNLLTVHTNNTTERVRINNDGDVIVGSGITVSPDGNIFATGITTAATFSGSGASLTNLPAANITGTLPAISDANLTNLDASDLASGTVPTARLGSGTASSSTFLRGDSTFAAVTSTTINSNADNRIITGSGTANTLNGEANLTFDGNALSQAIDSNDEGVNITASGAHAIRLKYDSNQSSANDTIVFQSARWNGTEVASMHFRAGADTTNKDDGRITFHTTPSGGSNTERLRIDSNGKVLVNTTTASTVGNSQYSFFEVSGNTSGSGGAGHAVIKRAETSASLSDGDTIGRLIFSSLDGGDFAYIQSNVDGSPSGSDFPANLRFHTCADGASSSTERMRIASTGFIGMGGATAPEEVLDLGNNVQINLKVGGRGYLGQGYSTAATILGHSVKAKTTGTVSGGMEVTETNSGGGAPAAIRMVSGRIEFHGAASGTSGATFDTERVRIASDGEVFIGEGFGATNRSTILSISGTYQEATGAWAQMGLYSSDSYAQNKGGSLVFGGQDGSVAKQYFAGIAGVKENSTSADYAGVMKFYTRPSGSTPVERMRIHSNGAISVGANDSARSFTIFNTVSNDTILRIQNDVNNEDTGLEIVNVGASGTRTFRMGGYIQANNTDTQFASSEAFRFYVDTPSGTNEAFRLQTNKRVITPQVYSTAGSSMRDVQCESDGTLACLSSITAAKINIADVTDISWLYNLKPKTFNFRKKTTDAKTGVNTYLDEAETEKAYGLLAEDVETVNKDFCFYDKDSEGNDVLAGVYYKTMVVPLLKAVQELKAENTALKDLIKNSSSFAALKSSL